MISNYLTDRFRAGTDDSVARNEEEHAAALEDRDRMIAELEQANFDLQTQIELLEANAEQDQFRRETLERSYSKQLDDAREATAAGEKTIGVQRERIESLEETEKTLRREIEGLRRRLEPFGPDPASIDDLLSGTPAPHPRPDSDDSVSPAQSEEHNPTSEEMLDPDEMFVDQKK